MGALSAGPVVLQPGRPAAGRRPFLAVALAVLLVAGAAGAVVMFGLRSAPAFPPLAEQTDAGVPGRLALLRLDGDRSCVSVLTMTTGTERRLVCLEDGEAVDQVAWTTQGRIRANNPFAGTALDIEPATGTYVAATEPLEPDWGTAGPEGAVLTSASDDGRATLLLARGGHSRTLLSARGPEDYSFVTTEWSADGHWVLVHDSERRLLVVSVEDPGPALLVAQNVDLWRWEAPAPPPLPATEQAPVSAPVGPLSGPVGRCDDLVQYQLSGGRPVGVAADPDGSVWFTDQPAVTSGPPGGDPSRAPAAIGHMTVRGLVTRYPLPVGSRPWAITRGPDGSYWFTDTGTNSVGRITPGGVISIVAIPTTDGNPMGIGGSGSGPFDIVAGPDGALWFVESAADQLGRVTTDLSVTEYPLPGRDRRHANPGGITVGSDGGLWVSEPLAGRLARVDPATGAIREVVVPDAGAGPVTAATLAAAADGAIWFDAPGALGRMSTTEVFSRFPLPAQSAPWAVTVGPDGAVWSVDGSGGRLLRISLDGAVTEFPPLEAGGRMGLGSPRQLDAGPDGLWFAQPDTARLGRVACP